LSPVVRQLEKMSTLSRSELPIVVREE
jgi:hypothetical protein